MDAGTFFAIACAALLLIGMILIAVDLITGFSTAAVAPPPERKLEADERGR